MNEYFNLDDTDMFESGFKRRHRLFMEALKRNTESHNERMLQLQRDMDLRQSKRDAELNSLKSWYTKATIVAVIVAACIIAYIKAYHG